MTTATRFPFTIPLSPKPSNPQRRNRRNLSRKPNDYANLFETDWFKNLTKDRNFLPVIPPHFLHRRITGRSGGFR
jgi:hypothetical protein